MAYKVNETRTSCDEEGRAEPHHVPHVRAYDGFPPRSAVYIAISSSEILMPDLRNPRNP